MTTTTNPADGFTVEELAVVTGFGLRRVDGSEAVDTIANKLAAGALTPEGARRALRKAVRIESSQVVDLAGDAMLTVMIAEDGKTYTLATHYTGEGVVEKLVYPHGVVRDFDPKATTDATMANIATYLANAYR